MANDPLRKIVGAAAGDKSADTGSRVDFTKETAHSGEIREVMTRIHRDITNIISALDMSVHESVAAISEDLLSRKKLPGDVDALIRKQLEMIFKRDLAQVISMPETYGA